MRYRSEGGEKQMEQRDQQRRDAIVTPADRQVKPLVNKRAIETTSETLSKSEKCAVKLRISGL